MKPFFLTKLEALQIAAPILFLGILLGFAAGYLIARRRQKSLLRLPRRLTLLNN